MREAILDLYISAIYNRGCGKRKDVERLRQVTLLHFYVICHCQYDKYYRPK